MANDNLNSLPGGVSVESLFKFIETLRRKGNNGEDAKKILGFGASQYQRIKAALRAFDIIKKDSFEFTEPGHNLAFSPEPDRKELFKRAVLKYLPYESQLYQIFSKGNVTETTLDDVLLYWGKSKLGGSERNLSDAGTLFMGILDYIGLGRYTIGRRNKPTRIIWEKNAKQIFEESLNDNDTPMPSQIETDTDTNTETERETRNTEKTDTDSDIDPLEAESESLNHITSHVESTADTTSTPQTDKFSIKTGIMPNISITVDMSTWPEEKIKAFFKYAYGLFGEAE